MKLRPYQEKAIADVRARYRAGDRRVVLVLPTGSGKTVLAAAMVHAAVDRGSEILFLAHRRELIQQCSNKLALWGVDHGVLMANHPRFRPWLKVQVASVPTLCARFKRNDDDKRASKAWLPTEPSLIFVDEAHHARAESYNEVMLRYPKARVLGLTATPWRTDGRGLGELFASMVVGPQSAELISSGALVPVSGFSYMAPDTSKIKKQRGGDYSEADSEKAMAPVILCGSIVREWMAHAYGQRTILFAPSVAKSKDLVRQFYEMGVAAAHLDAHTPDGERAEVLAKLDSGEIKVVCNMGILTEGFDSPRVTCIVLARPTASDTLALQMIGRGLRPVCLDCCAPADWRAPACPECGSANVKRKARIHDHARVLYLHGLPDEERTYTLLGDSAKTGRVSPKTCPSCFCVNPASATACRECGKQFGSGLLGPDGLNPGPPVQELANAQMIDLEILRKIRDQMKAISDDDRAGEYRRLQEEARVKGYQNGWAAHRYRATFGDWPNFAPELLDRVRPRASPLVAPFLVQGRMFDITKEERNVRKQARSCGQLEADSLAR